MSEEFSRNIDNFESWKLDVNRTLSRFRLWLRRNQLFNQDTDNQLRKLQSSLKQQHLTLAFVGEFSRGKTELINSLFFAQFGQRILPSEAGRTTMCPTELFYDNQTDRAYLRLLPIETRLLDTPLMEYIERSDEWVELPLNTLSAQEMTKTLSTISDTKEISLKEALKLGFKEESLELADDDPNRVVIPIWRHALISFPHEILKSGLHILDTPGLNALGSEPELTLKLLPDAQAIVFLLGADTGVTASDMDVWEKYIKPIDPTSVFAVLNKVDTLWDELSSRKKIDRAVKRMVNTTARQLKISSKQIMAVSAQKALVAKVRNDKSLLIKSQIAELEHILSGTLLQNKEKVIYESTITTAKDLVNEAAQLIRNKNHNLLKQKRELESLDGSNKEKTQQIINNNKEIVKQFEHRAMAIKPSQRLLERQTQILLGTISNKVLSKEISVTLSELVNCRTSVGLYKNMRQFHNAITGIMKELTREAELTNKMTLSLYKKFAEDFHLNLLEPKLFPAKRLNRELEAIIKHSKRMNNSLFTAVTEHSAAIRRFFSSTVNEVMGFFKHSRQELIYWTNNVISPLKHQLKTQQELIAQHQRELSELSQSKANLIGKIKGLSRLIKENEMELQTAEELLKFFADNKSSSTSNNIVRLSSINR